MSWFSQWAHPADAYKKAQEEMQKHYDEAQAKLDPYNQNGVTAGKNLTEEAGKLTNPAALQDEWSKNYQESDIAKQNEAMANQRGLDSASSQGLFGSSPAIQAIQSGTAGIVAGDRQKYLDDLMQKYLAGVGINQGLNTTGAGAATTQSNNATKFGEDSATNTFNQNNAQGNLFGDIAGNALPVIAGGIFGGPAGAASAAAGKWSTKGGKK